MKRVGLIAIIFALTVVCCILIYTSYRGKEVVYANEELGFQMAFPNHWKTQFTIKEDPEQNRVELTSPQNKIGTLAYIIKYEQEEWVPEHVGTTYQILAEQAPYIYILTYPGDVQWDLGDKKAEEKHKELRGDLEQKNYRFSLLK